MKKTIIALLAIILLTGCRAIQPVFVITLSEMIFLGAIYIIVAALLAAYLSSDTKRESVFWIWFIANIIFIPLGIIVSIVKACRK